MTDEPVKINPRSLIGGSQQAIDRGHVDPRSITCPNCNAQPGKPCTQPTDDGRRPVSYYHLARDAGAPMPRPRYAH